MDQYERWNRMCPAGSAGLGDAVSFAESGGLVGLAGRKLFVNSVNGNDNNDGLSINEAKATIQAAVDLAQSYSSIFITGRFDEDVVGKDWGDDGIENVKIIGMDGGVGWYPNVPEWRSSNNTTGIPLILRAPGWSVERIKFRVPTTNVAVKLQYRVTDADVYDASGDNLAAVCRILGCWFYGGLTGKTAINLVGAPYNTLIQGNYFSLIHQGDNSGKCITCTESSMASPYRTHIIGNVFNEVDGAIDFSDKSANGSIITGNVIQGSSHAGYSAGKKCDLGPSGNDNTVYGNFFGGDYSITGGYRAGSGDSWMGNIAFDKAEGEVEASGHTNAIPA